MQVGGGSSKYVKGAGGSDGGSDGESKRAEARINLRQK